MGCCDDRPHLAIETGSSHGNVFDRLAELGFKIEPCPHVRDHNSLILPEGWHTRPLNGVQIMHDDQWRARLRIEDPNPGHPLWREIPFVEFFPFYRLSLRVSAAAYSTTVHWNLIDSTGNILYSERHVIPHAYRSREYFSSVDRIHTKLTNIMRRRHPRCDDLTAYW